MQPVVQFVMQICIFTRLAGIDFPFDQPFSRPTLVPFGFNVSQESKAILSFDTEHVGSSDFPLTERCLLRASLNSSDPRAFRGLLNENS